MKAHTQPNMQAAHDKKVAMNEASKALQAVHSPKPAATENKPAAIENKPAAKPETSPVTQAAPEANAVPKSTLKPISLDDLREHITGLTSFDLRGLVEFISATQAGRQVAEANAAREQIAAIARNLGMSVQELVGGAKGLKERKQGTLPGVPVPVKYKHPETGATWSGRGRRPAWVAEWLDAHSQSFDGITV